MQLYMSDATFKKLDKKVLVNSKPTLGRCGALLDFCHFWKEKSGENIGAWLEKIHADVGMEPSHIGSHNVDGASNAGKSVETLKLITSNRRS